MNRARIRTSPLGVAALLTVTLAGSTLWAQPQRGRPDRPGDRTTEREQPESGRPGRVENGARGDGGPMLDQITPERFRVRLADLLGRMEDHAERLRSAIAMLDEGKTVSEVIDGLGGPMRARRLAEVWQEWSGPGLGPAMGGPGDGPGEGLGDGPGDRPRGLTRQVEPEEVLAFLRERGPRLAARVEELRERDPERAKALLTRMSPRISEVLAVREHDPELGELMAADFELGMRFVEASGRYSLARKGGDEAAIDKARTALREIAGEMVDLKIAQREHELKKLEERLGVMHEEIDRQRAERDSLIDEMIEQAGQGRFRGGPPEERPGRGGPPDNGRRDRRGSGEG